jgi:hypothetical protein
VVLKPSELSAYSGGLLWGEIFTEAGLPPNVLNIVTHAPGEAEEIGDELVEHPHVRRINFTGSTAVGRKLAEAAGRNLKRVVLELGGYNPLIVLADADLDYAVDATTFGAFLHQGQICMSARRIIVERAMWWPGPTSATWHEAHNSPGTTQTGTRWALAEGEVSRPVTSAFPSVVPSHTDHQAEVPRPCSLDAGHRIFHHDGFRRLDAQ